MTDPIVYGPTFSTYTRSVRLALEEKGVAYRLEEVDPRSGATRGPDHLVRHPFGRVPVLDHDGFVLYETAAIVRYVDRAFPGPALQPKDMRQAARMDQIIGIIDAYGYPSVIGALAIERLLVPMSGGEPNEETIRQAMPRIRLTLAELERLQGDNDHLAADGFSLADLIVAPVFAYLIMTPESGELLQPHPGLMTWWSRIAGRDGMNRTQPRFD